MQQRAALIVGGTSGLGLALAHLLLPNHQVYINGRRDPTERNLTFISLELDSPDLAADLDHLLRGLPALDLLVYAAGFRQEGKIDHLTDADLSAMARVGLLAPALLLRRILRKQDSLGGLIAITSTSQWTPRLQEPMYTAVKTGLAMLANSLSLDPRIRKVLVAGPAGMVTRFWENSSRNTSTMLDPVWVAEQVIGLYQDDFQYRFARILRDPPRVEIVETR